MIGMLGRWAALVMCSALWACGGGGGGDSGSNDGPVKLTAPAQRDIDIVERNGLTFQVEGRISGLKGGQQFYVAVAFSDQPESRLFSDVRLANPTVYDTIFLDVDLRTDLATGLHEELLQIAVCDDAECKKLLAEPTSTRVVVNVKPNIGVAARTELSRVGAEAAPSIDIPVSVPAEAGTITISAPGSEALAAAWVDGKLRITSQQVRAGTYELPVSIRSAQLGSYSASTTVVYTVLPPASGEQGMSIVSVMDPISVAATDGQLLTRRITLTKATWSSAPVTAEIFAQLPETPAILSIVNVGGDDFDLIIDTRGATGNFYSGGILFSGPPQVGQISRNVSVSIDSALLLNQPPAAELNETSTLADTRFSTPVTMVDGGRVNWSATVSTPWLRLLRSTGVTGQDALSVEIDTSLLTEYTFIQSAFIDVSVDRPGVQPVRLIYTMSNALQAITRSSPGALAGTSGRIFLSGSMINRSDLVSSGLLQVTGAALRSATYVLDPRFVGNRFMVVLDVDGTTPGTPVSATIDTPLLRTSVTLPVHAASVGPAANVALPYGARRPATWSERERAWFFAGGGTVFRYGLSGSAWVLGSTALPGVIDIDVSPEESVLLALSADGLRGLDPGTLSQRWAATQAGSVGADADTRLAVMQKALSHNADGSFFVATRSADASGSSVSGLRFDWLRPSPNFDWEFGTGVGALDQAGDPPFGIVRSAGHESNLLSRGTVKSNGTRALYLASHRGVQPGYTDPTLNSVADGMALLSASDSGLHVLTTSGLVQTRYGSVSLATVLATGRSAMGYAITGDGRYGLVYSVKLVGTGDAQVASEPEIAVVELGSNLLAPTLLSSIVMSAPVGCGSPRALGETCVHEASLAIDPKSGMVLVLGPRGAEVVALPDAVQSAGKAARERAKSLRPTTRTVLPARAVPGVAAR
ncbi:MAG: hypothetical protein ABL916_22250 [Burkholderiaceae bacterium]